MPPSINPPGDPSEQRVFVVPVDRLQHQQQQQVHQVDQIQKQQEQIQQQAGRLRQLQQQQQQQQQVADNEEETTLQPVRFDNFSHFYHLVTFFSDNFFWHLSRGRNLVNWYIFRPFSVTNE